MILNFIQSRTRFKKLKMKKTLLLIALCFAGLFCFTSLMTGCENQSYEERHANWVERGKARLMPFEYIKSFNKHEDGFVGYFHLICDHSTGVVYLKYDGHSSAGLTVYLDENLNVARCDKTVK